MTDPLKSLRYTIAFDSLDYSIDKRHAWIYGIVMGWDKESLIELEEKGFWDLEQSKQLKKLHKRFKELRNK